MMRKYLAEEKMATEADLATVQRKNFSTYNDFLQEFTLVALRIPEVTDRIMSKYFLRQFSEFDKDKILSAYQQTSKFVNTRDVDFSIVTDLAEKTVVTETLALLKEGEVIDLTGRTGDKVKTKIESLHERVHRVDNKIERMESALLVMQAQVSRPPLPSQEAVVPPGIANRGFGRRDPASEQCKYCTAMGHYVRACPKLNHDILKRRCTRSLKGQIFGPQGERVNWNSPEGMRRAIIMLNGLEIAVVEAEPVVDIIWEQLRGRGPQVNFILESDGRDRVNATTRLGMAGRRIIRDTVMEKVAGSFKKKRQEDEVLGVMVAKKESEVELGASLPKRKEVRMDVPEIALEIPNLLQLIKTLRYHKVGVDSATLAKFEGEVQKGYCLNGKLVSIQPRVVEATRAIPAVHFLGERSRKKVVRKYKPVGKKAKSVSILLETSKEVAMEKEEVLRVIQERRATEGHRIPDEVADTMKIGVEGFLTEEEDRLIKRTCQEFHLAFAFSDRQKGRLDAKLIPPVRIHTVEHECWNDKGPSYELGIAGEVTDLRGAKMDSFVAEPTASPYANRWFVFQKPNKTLRDRRYTAMHTPVGQLRMQVTPMGFTNAVAEAQRRMLAVAGDMFPEKCEPYIDDNPIEGAQEKNETEVQPGIRRWRTLGRRRHADQRDEERRERPIRFESRTLNSAERRYSQFKKEVLAILHCLKTFQAYLFGRRFILRIDSTNVEGALKNYRPIAPTVGRWVKFIWQFDYKIERIVEIRNKEDGLRWICITTEGVEDAEPINAFLEFEGGTLAVDNEMMGEECASGELLIQTLEKGARAVVPELREGPVTTRGHKEERDILGAIVGPKEELIAMAVEGGREAVISLVESWEKKELQWMVNQMQERKDEDHERKEVFYAQIYKGIVREIGLLMVGNNQPTEVSNKARQEAERLCVPIKLIEPYHPEANAPVEKGHRTLKNTIAKLAADHLGSWPRYLKQVVFSENMTPKRTTGCIPTELWYGREIDFPVEALIPTWNRLEDDPRMTTEELIEARCQQVLKNEEVMEDIANRVLDSRMSDKARWDQVKNVTKEPLQVGEMVLLRNSTQESTWSGQLGRRFKGPYRVGLNTFELEDLDGTGLKGPFPGQRLVWFLSRDPVEQWLQEAEDKEIEGQ
ncbi:hypothetical protein CBR_g37901 [Chara braunii]|uniref:Integrase catalytic domain-containing protein n=1 Tax=Chara braunii TaxID=69332 RepID=A0A388LP72_CHABU|nr:hypothetical protein CBR_g37901 [Chara braunii]|eukprot:GBG84025.1 hypothetical protein CBR_g37901 [Chara braunii]